MSELYESGDEVSTASKSISSSNPPIVEGYQAQASLESQISEQGAHIDALVADVEVLRRSGSVMEDRLQKLHSYIVLYMGKNCPKELSEMKWTPEITILNETQSIQSKKVGLQVAATNKDVVVVTEKAKKGGQNVVPPEVTIDDGDSDTGDTDEKYSVNYDISIYSDTSGRSLYGVRGTSGYCITYTTTDYFSFSERLVAEKTAKALKAAGVRSIKELQQRPEKHFIAIQSFVTDMLLSETERFAGKKPLFLECAIDQDSLQRTAQVLANVQPEPVRSSLALVLSQWGFTDTGVLADVFLSVLQVVDGYVTCLRDGLPPADARRVPKKGDVVDMEGDISDTADDGVDGVEGGE